MKLVHIDAELRCSAEQAERLIGHVDHVEYGADTGIALLNFAHADTGHLLSETTAALDKLDGLLGTAGLSYDDVQEVKVSAEALVEDNGTWRRRGSLVTL